MDLISTKEVSNKPPETTSSTDPVLSWDNYTNNDFYETLKADGLKKFAKLAGLASGCDLEELKPYWLRAKSTLEVGAGYGRVIDFLLKNGYVGKLSAIERCSSMFNYVNKKYGSKINLIKMDLHNLENLNQKFDLILWLWSGIADFSMEEQKFIFQKLSSLLTEAGTLVIDTIPESNTPLDVQKIFDGPSVSFKLEINGTAIYTRNATLKELQEYAKLAGFNKITYKTYYTDTQRPRLLYFFN